MTAVQHLPTSAVPVPDAHAAAPADAAVAAREDVTSELVARAVADRPELSILPARDSVLVAAWVASLRSARTRRAYAGDWLAWRGWLTARGIDVLAATRVHVDLWVRQQQDAGAKPTSICRRLSAVASFYRHAAAHDLLPGQVPTDGVVRPAVDPDHTSTVGLDRAEAQAILAAAAADHGPAYRRTLAIARLLVHNAARCDELLAADVADLGHDRGHRVLTVIRKGGRPARLPLTPTTWTALEDYLTNRAATAGLDTWADLDGPLLATATGGRMRPNHLWELVRRLARAAGIPCWADLSPHSLRHTGITLALDAGASLRDVQDWAGHRDPRTTRRYDRSRHSLDRSPAYTLAAYLDT